MFIPYVLFFERLCLPSLVRKCGRRNELKHLEVLTCVRHIGTDDIAPFKLECDKTPFDLIRIWMSWQELRNRNWLDFREHRSAAYGVEMAGTRAS